MLRSVFNLNVLCFVDEKEVKVLYEIVINFKLILIVIVLIR